MKRILNVVLAACCSAVAIAGWSLDDGDGTGNTCDNFNPYRNPYFGDLHVHTEISGDAAYFGAQTTPEQAYQFAQGQEIGLHPFDTNGVPLRHAQIDRPLDFAMVSDHAELINPVNWQALQQVAAQYYDRSQDCNFTTFVGYEWTRNEIVRDEQNNRHWLNLHRNVLFRNSVVPAAAVSSDAVQYAESLWDSLQSTCLDLVDGDNYCDVLTIPHNSNFSQGRMFEAVRPDGAPYDLNYAKRRARFEPLIEVVQHKGQSECLFMASDEMCDFEVVSYGDLYGFNNVNINPFEPKVEGTVRYALTEGLRLKSALGANPLKFGMVGSTDTHLGTPGLVEESAAYPGHLGFPVLTGITDWTPEWNAGGLTVVWAEQNSRAALFDAMQRRETYATSGPRHILRFFAGWDLPPNICSFPDSVEVAYETGVPMGSTLPQAGIGQTAPLFFASAFKDAGTASHPGDDLQRIQIIKGWTDNSGDKHEQVFEVAGDPFNGASVDTDTCAASGPGFESLCEVWQDPYFNLQQNAYYYVRVLENPSCRWSQRQCIAAATPVNCDDPESVAPEYAACCDASIPKTVQERSWSSPIWYDKPPPAGC